MPIQFADNLKLTIQVLYATKLFQDRVQEPVAAPGFLLYQYHGVNRWYDGLFTDLPVCTV